MEMKYTVVQTTQFVRDVRRLRKRGLEISKLESVVGILSLGGVLPRQFKDHPLKDEGGKRECHIAPDWLLVYRKREREIILELIRTGTHRDVGFEK